MYADSEDEPSQNGQEVEQQVIEPTPVTPKRGRGRPKGTGGVKEWRIGMREDMRPAPVDPNKRGRGRPKGSKTVPKPKTPVQLRELAVRQCKSEEEERRKEREEEQKEK
ncbi:hypothetical protein PENTCL1PPCAC_816, partial [Pristionchus entomophagus]